MIHTVFFDVDDTLYNFHYADEIAVDYLAVYMKENFGWEKEEFLRNQKAAMSDIRRFAGTSGGYRTRVLRYQNILEAAGLPIAPHALNMSRIYMETLLEHMIPEKGVELWMKDLKDLGVRIGIASDATALQQFLKLDKLGLLPYIDVIITSEETGVEKPDPRFFARCNEKCGCSPNEVLFIGDNPSKDYAGAKAAGYHALWYNPAGKTSEAPMRELQNYDEAPAIFSEICSQG